MSNTATAPQPYPAPTAHPRLLTWVREVAELTTPDMITDDGEVTVESTEAGGVV